MLTKSARQQISQSLKKYYKNRPGPRKGIKLTKKTKQLLSQNKIKYFKNSSNRKKDSEALKKYYKKHPERRKEISLKQKRYLATHKHPMLGKHHHKNTKIKMRSVRLGITFSNKWKQKLSNASMGEKNSMYKHQYTDITRKKMRISRLKHIASCRNNGDPVKPNVGRNEKQILNLIEKQNNIKLKRQHCVDGYFIDGYCVKTNTVYEVDEKYHHIKEQKKKDVERERYLRNKLNCNFVRLDEKEYLLKLGDA